MGNSRKQALIISECFGLKDRVGWNQSCTWEKEDEGEKCADRKLYCDEEREANPSICTVVTVQRVMSSPFRQLETGQRNSDWRAVNDCFHDRALFGYIAFFLSLSCWPHGLTTDKKPGERRSTAKLDCTVTIYCPVKSALLFLSCCSG